MELNYYPETDSLYINLSEPPSVESQEISDLARTFHHIPKKSKRGIRTPKKDIDLIKRRLRQAKEMEKEL